MGQNPYHGGYSPQVQASLQNANQYHGLSGGGYSQHPHFGMPGVPGGSAQYGPPQGSPQHQRYSAQQMSQIAQAQQQQRGRSTLSRGQQNPNAMGGVSSQQQQQGPNVPGRSPNGSPTQARRTPPPPGNWVPRRPNSAINTVPPGQQQKKMPASMSVDSLHRMYAQQQGLVQAQQVGPTQNLPMGTPQVPGHSHFVGGNNRSLPNFPNPSNGPPIGGIPRSGSSHQLRPVTPGQQLQAQGQPGIIYDPSAGQYIMDPRMEAYNYGSPQPNNGGHNSMNNSPDPNNPSRRSTSLPPSHTTSRSGSPLDSHRDSLLARQMAAAQGGKSPQTQNQQPGGPPGVTTQEGRSNPPQRPTTTPPGGVHTGFGMARGPGSMTLGNRMQTRGSEQVTDGGRTSTAKEHSQNLSKATQQQLRNTKVSSRDGTKGTSKKHRRSHSIGNHGDKGGAHEQQHQQQIFATFAHQSQREAFGPQSQYQAQTQQGMTPVVPGGVQWMSEDLYGFGNLSGQGGQQPSQLPRVLSHQAGHPNPNHPTSHYQQQQAQQQQAYTLHQRGYSPWDYGQLHQPQHHPHGAPGMPLPTQAPLHQNYAEMGHLQHQQGHGASLYSNGHVSHNPFVPGPPGPTQGPLTEEHALYLQGGMTGEQ